MATHVSRLPHGLDPLVAEAKKRQRRSRILIVVAVLIVGGGFTAAAVVASAPSFPATRTIQSALVSPGSGDYSPMVMPDGTFRILLIFRNEAGGVITVEGARVLLSLRGAPLRRSTTIWETYRACGAAPSGCPPGGLSPPRFPEPLATPFRLSPGSYVYALLVFRLGSCGAVAAHIPKEALRRISTAPPTLFNLVRKITVVYRTDDGASIHQDVSHPTFALEGPDRYMTCP